MATHSSILAWKMPWTDASLNLRPGTECGVHDAILSLFDAVEFSLYGIKPLSPWDRELQNVL